VVQLITYQRNSLNLFSTTKDQTIELPLESDDFRSPAMRKMNLAASMICRDSRCNRYTHSYWMIMPNP